MFFSSSCLMFSSSCCLIVLSSSCIRTIFEFFVSDTPTTHTQLFWLVVFLLFRTVWLFSCAFCLIVFLAPCVWSMCISFVCPGIQGNRVWIHSNGESEQDYVVVDLVPEGNHVKEPYSREVGKFESPDDDRRVSNTFVRQHFLLILVIDTFIRKNGVLILSVTPSLGSMTSWFWSATSLYEIMTSWN